MPAAERRWADDEAHPAPSQTTAFYVQAILSFAISLTSMALALVYLPAAGWVRAFLGLDPASATEVSQSKQRAH